VRLVDTDVLIDIQRGHSPAIDWFSSLEELPAVPGFVVMELIQDAKNKDQVARAQRLVAPLTIAWPSEPDCERALLLFEQYHLSHKLGLLDALIATCALGRGATLCTFNVKHYRPVPGLEIEQPYRRG
jgi:predicted nucleic acid-binding protein